MDIEFVKKYLRVDFSDDDEFILLLMQVAEEYIINAVGYYNEDIAIMRLLMLVIISNLYEKRQMTVDKSNDKLMYTIRSMILQLQTGEENE